MPDSKSQFQHYISRFLLKNFEDPAYVPHHKVWCYALERNKCVFKSTKNLAGTSNAWDKEFSSLESKASKLIKNIIISKRERKLDISITIKENIVLLNYIVWLTTLQPKRAEFILNHPQNKEDFERWFYTRSVLSKEQEKLQLFYREKYERTRKSPSMLVLKQQHISRFEEIYSNFGEFYFLCTSMEDPFVLSDHYITPVVKKDYDSGGNPWESAAQLYCPIASDICLIWNNRKLTDAETNYLPEVEAINRTAVAYARTSKSKCIYGRTRAVLEKAVKDYRQKGYLGWQS